jgi:tripartite-type tricarboxylate transporter receptor subunit TctC
MLNEQLKKVLTAPDQAQQWRERGLDVIASSPEEFAAHIEHEQDKWGKVIKQRGIKAE